MRKVEWKRHFGRRMFVTALAALTAFTAVSVLPGSSPYVTAGYAKELGGSEVTADYTKEFDGINVSDSFANELGGIQSAKAAKAGKTFTETRGKCGEEVSWYFDSKTGTLSINGKGAMYDYVNEPSPFEQKINIKKIVIGHGVTTIGDYAFDKMPNLSSVEFTDTITSIGRRAFADDASLGNLSIPGSVKKLGDFAFAGCTKMNYFVVPSGVNTFSMTTISGCTSLEHLVFLTAKDITITDDEVYADRVSVAFTLYTCIYAPAGRGLVYNLDLKVNGKTGEDYCKDFPNISYKDLQGGATTFYHNVGEQRKFAVSNDFQVNEENSWIENPGVIEFINSSNAQFITKRAGFTDVIIFNEEPAIYEIRCMFDDLGSVSRFKTLPYYYEPVYWAATHGITVGVKSKDTGLYDNFVPQAKCTRAQMVTFLWRMAGCPEPESTEMKFTDVKTSDYFYKAVLWGSEQKIIEGYSNHTFRPQNECTRSQAVTFLWRFAGCPDPEIDRSQFSDITKKNTYFYYAVLWADENGITTGYPDGTFKPDRSCTRAQIVTFLYRFSGETVFKDALADLKQ